MRVFLNPGHALGDAPDPGCVNSALTLRECDLALTYGSLCGKYLEAAETYCYEQRGAGGRLAACLQNQLVKSLAPFDAGYKDRGVKAHPSFCVLRQTAMPAVLVETGFIDNEDADLLTRHGDDIARALARGVTDYANFLVRA